MIIIVVKFFARIYRAHVMVFRSEFLREGAETKWKQEFFFSEETASAEILPSPT